MAQVLLEYVCGHMKEEKLTRRDQHVSTMGKLCLTSRTVFYDKMTEFVDEGRAVDVTCLSFSCLQQHFCILVRMLWSGCVDNQMVVS